MGTSTPTNPAELYEHFFGPPLFVPWASLLVDRADPRPGERILDLACGTGIVARRVAEVAGPGVALAGVDRSPDMLAVARRLPVPGGVPVDWREGDATALDLPDDSFDVVVCQQGLQFFQDRAAAAGEMRRVLAAGGRAVLATWCGLDHHELLAASTNAVARHLEVTAAELDTPFSFGDARALEHLLRAAGFARVDVDVHTMDAHFPSADDFIRMTTVAAAAVLPAYADVVTDPRAQAELVRITTEATGDLLDRHRDGAGLRLPWTAHLTTARAPVA